MVRFTKQSQIDKQILKFEKIKYKSQKELLRAKNNLTTLKMAKKDLRSSSEVKLNFKL